MSKDLFAVHNRLFNHRPFLAGEVSAFTRTFSSSDGKEADVERIFTTLERVTELRDADVDRLMRSADKVLPNVNANLLVAQSMSNKILDAARSREIEQALESSRVAREKEWTAFTGDIQDRCARIDDAYKSKEADLRKQFDQLEKNLQQQQ